jgi:hypothetical protein
MQKPLHCVPKGDGAAVECGGEVTLPRRHRRVIVR